MMGGRSSGMGVVVCGGEMMVEVLGVAVGLP